MKIYLMTDMEGVAGVTNFDDWCQPEGRYYELGKELLTEEVNAAARGFFDGGATGVLVADGHGHGGISPALLDPRVELSRGWVGPYPFGLDGSFAGAAWVGQHAKSGSEFAHLAHTGWFNCLEDRVNGVAIGEFGEMALCAGELGVPVIFAAGGLAFTGEAAALAPGVETVAVKRGVTPGTGDECTAEEYARRNLGAVHTAPAGARQRIYEGARRAAARLAAGEQFTVVRLDPPYERVVKMRPTADQPAKTVTSRHDSSVIGLLNGR